jgi:hypothetical protein
MIISLKGFGRPLRNMVKSQRQPEQVHGVRQLS